MQKLTNNLVNVRFQSIFDFREVGVSDDIQM